MCIGGVAKVHGLSVLWTKSTTDIVNIDGALTGTQTVIKGEMDPAEIRPIRWVFIEKRGAEGF